MNRTMSMTKNRMIWMTLVAAVIGSFALGRASAEDGEAAPDMAEMEAWMALGEPGEQHAELMKMVGTWDCEIKDLMMGTTTKGSAGFTAMFGDRFLRQDFTGEVMGEAFTGFGLQGYDNATKKHQGVWTDSMSTGLMFLLGEEDASGKFMTQRGSFVGPGAKECKCRYVTTHDGDDKFTLEMFMDMGQGEAKSMEIVYTRRK